MAEDAKIVPIQRKLKPGSFKLDVSGYVNSSWTAILDENDSVDDLLVSDFWFHVDKAKLTARDTITAYTFDGQRRIVLFVRAVSKTLIKLAIIADQDFSPKGKAAEDASLSIKWNVGKRRFEVLSKDTNQVLQSDFLVKEDAQAWIAEHKKAMAA